MKEKLKATRLSTVVRTDIPVYPFLLAVWPIVLRANQDASWVFAEELPLPIVGSLILTTIVLAISWLVLRNRDKACLVTAAFMICFFYFEAFEMVLNIAIQQVAVLIIHEGIKVPIWVFASAYWPVVIFTLIKLGRIKTIDKGVVSALNLVALLMVVYNGGSFIMKEIKTQKLADAVIRKERASDEKLALSRGTAPDVYFIIMDGLCRQDIFDRVRGIKEDHFVDYMKLRGFRVCSESRTNYETTFPSLSAVLNMEHLDRISRQVGEQNFEQQVKVLGSVIRDNRIARLLRRIGYKFVNYSSGFGPTDFNPRADINIESGPGSWFMLRILDATAFKALPNELDPRMTLSRWKRQSILDKIGDVTAIPGPKFVFIHVLLPHAPYVYHGDGQPVKEQYEKLFGMSRAQYIDQGVYAQKFALQLVDGILTKGGRKSLIVVQGDHGPHFSEDHDYLHHVLALPILNAYHLPEGGNEKIYEQITPVNSFRIIFNHYFGTTLPLLEDINFHSFVWGPLKFQQLPPPQQFSPTEQPQAKEPEGKSPGNKSVAGGVSGADPMKKPQPKNQSQ